MQLTAHKQDTTIATELNQQTLEFLGLTKQPFSNEILSEKNYFNHQTLEKISEQLIHQIQFSELLLVIEGLQGSGKTSLFRRFIQNDISNTKILSIQAEATDTLTQVQQKMSLHLQDLGDANHLDDNLKNLQMFDQTPLIVMDNSHVLSDTTLQELLRYQHSLKAEHDTSLKILFFANTGFSETLKKITDLNDSQMYVQHMPEYTPKQIDSFITHRLYSAGYQGELLLNNNDIQLLFKKSNGTPASIMSRAVPIIEKIIIDKTRSPNKQLKLILSGVTIVLLLCVAAYVYFTTIAGNETPEDTIIENIDSNTDNSVAEQTLPTEDALTSTSVSSADKEIIELPSDTPEVVDINEDTKAKAPQAQKQAAAIVDDKEHKNSDTIEQFEPVATNQNKPETTPKPIVATPKTPTPASKPKPIATKPLHPALQQLNAMGLHNANWLIQQPATDWTMQLLGAREPETLLKFARKHQLQAGTSWYKTWLKGQPYYVLVYGSFPNRDQARSAINSLKPELKKLKPWIKSLKSIQQSLK